MRALARTLVLSGLGMTICNGSYPASQGEHLVSHYIDMFAPASRPSYLHGEQVAVATLAMARLQKRMLDGAAAGAARDDRVGGVARRPLRPGDRPLVLARIRAQGADRGRRGTLTQRVRERWDDGARRDRCASSLPAERIADVLRRAGAPTTPAQIGVTPAFFARAVREARFLRDRYTFLDLAGDAGCLDEAR